MSRYTFRQGIARYPQPGFLQVSGNSVNLLATNGPVFFNIAHKDTNYEVIENQTINNAWDLSSLASVENAWLYLDLNPTTGQRTFGFTTVQPTSGSTPPTNPVNDLHWFDTSTNVMKVYRSSTKRFVERIRIFAALIRTPNSSPTNAGIIPLGSNRSRPFAGSQVGLDNNPVFSGRIVFDASGNPVVKIANNTFFTTEDQFLVNGSDVNSVRIESDVLTATAGQNMSAYTVVRFGTNSTVVPANYNDSEDTVIAILLEDANVGENVVVVAQGVVTNQNWNWLTPGRRLWVRLNGTLVDYDPNQVQTSSFPNARAPVAKVINKNTIIFQQGLGAQGPQGPSGADDTINSLNEIPDVEVTGVLDGQILTYSAVTTNWTAQTLSIPSPVVELNDLTDVSISGTPSIGNVLQWNGSLWTPGTISTSEITGSPSTNDFAIYNGSSFAATTPANARIALGLNSGGPGDIWVDTAGDTMTGDLTFSNGRIKTSHGTVNAPGYAFEGSPLQNSTGFYFTEGPSFGSPTKTTSKVGISVEGNQIATFEWLGSPAKGRLNVSSDTVVPGGVVQTAGSSATDPAYTFFDDESSGMFQDSVNELGFSVGGNEALRIQADGTLSVAGTIGYESLVINEDDIPNKKYVDDAVSSSGGSPISAGDGLVQVGGQFDVGAGVGIVVNPNDIQLDTSSTRNTDHSAVDIIAGAGLTGGGTIDASRTIDIGAGDGITVNANDVAVDSSVVRTSDGLGALDGVASSVSNAPRLHILFRSGSPVRWINGNELQVNENSFVQATVPFYITPGTAAVPGMAFSQSTGTGIGLGSPSFLVFYTAGTQKLYVEPDGTLHTLVGAYENLVTDDDDIPNKKYVDDEIAALTQSNLDLNNNNIVNLANPITGTDAATKQYVDQIASGITARQAVTVYVENDLATLYNTGSPPTAWTFASGSPQGVGTTLTAPVNGQLPDIDNVTTFLNERILVANQNNPEQNGIYVLTTLGDVSTPAQLTRCGNCNENDEIPSSFVFVQEGTVYADTGWVASVNDIATFQIDQDPITWSQFTGGGSVVGGAGLTLTGTVLDVGAGLGITVNANDVQLDTLNTRNIDHSLISILAGAGLTGGGTIVADRTLNIGAGDGITVNANDVAVDSTVVRTTGAQTIAGVKTFSARIEGNGGSITNPSFTFSGDINTGMYNPNPDTVGISAGADDCAYFTNQQIQGRSDGTQADPPFSFIGDPDTGMYNSAANQLSFATGGTARISIQSDGTLVSNTASYETLVTGNNDIPNKKYVDDQIAAINVGSPVTAGNGLTETGNAFNVGAGDGITVNANDVAVDSTVVRTTGAQTIGGAKTFTTQVVAAGDLFAPNFAMSGATDTGMYLGGGGTLAFAVDANAYLAIDPDGTIRSPLNNYETLVTADDDIPNKKYVDDLVDDPTIVRTTGAQTIGGVKTLTSQLIGVDGTVSVPSFAFTSSTDTGFYRSGANAVSVTNGGTQTFQFTTAQVRGLDGNAAFPAYSFLSDTNTGMYLQNPDTIRFATGGVANLQIASTGKLNAGVVNYETLVVADNDIPNKKYVDDAIAAISTGGSPISAGNGLVQVGGQFDVGAGDGITVSANDVAVNSTVVRTTGNQTVGGTKTFSDPVRFASGTVSAPSITFNGDINTGIYRPSLDTVGISAGADDCAYFTNQQIQGRTDGTQVDPPFSFIGDPDTGMYNSAANQLSFATGGTARISIQSDGTLVSNTTLYENLVTGNNDIPNKKYVDDQIAAINVGSPVTAGNGLVQVGGQFDVGAGDGITVNANDVAVDNTVLRTTGAQTISGIKTFQDPTSFDPGTVSLPGIYFNGDVNTGMYRPSLDTVGITAGGDDCVYFTGQQIRGRSDGTQADPPFSFIGDPDTGMYNSAANQLSFATGGTARISIQSDGTLVSNTASYETLVTGNNDIPNKKYVDDEIAAIPVGSTTLAGLTDVAIATPITGQVLVYDGIAADWENNGQLTIAAGAVTTTLPNRTVVGSASAPSYSFSTDTDTGMFRRGVNQIGWACGGTERLFLDASGNLTADANVTAFSDIREKENIEPIENALTKVRNVNGYTFNRKGNNERQTGVIAQEILEVLPEAVCYDETDDRYSVAYGNIVGLLINAIHELEDKVEQQSALIEELRNK